MTLYAVNGTTQRFVEYQTLAAEGNTLAAGASITKTFNYVIQAGDDKGGYLFDLMVRADNDGQVEEGTAGEANNDYTETFKFYAPLGEVTLRNDGTNISAEWPAHDDTNEKFIIRYTHAESGETVQVETRDNTPSIVFPEGTLIANNTVVEVISVHTDGSTHLYAEGTALADLEIVTVETNGPAYLGKATDVIVTVNNVGVAQATGVEGNLFGVKVQDTGIWATQNTVALNPNETLEMTIFGGIPAATYTEAGTYEMIVSVDDSLDGGGAGRIYETDDSLGVDATRNNLETLKVVALAEGTIGLTNTDGTVSATWADPNTTLTAEGYQLTYTSNGVTKTIDVTGTTYTFTEPLDNNTDVIISAKYSESGDEYYRLAATKALADLVITNIVKPDNTYLNVAFDLQVEIKNQGTAQVPASSENFEQDYGYWVIVSMEQNANITANTLHQGHTSAGLLAGASDTVTISGITATVLGDYELDMKVDSPGFIQAQEAGFITESDETNNIGTVTLNIVEEPFVQEKMDWEPLVSDVAGEEGNTYTFTVGGTSQRGHIYYKILDTSVTDKHYIDIIPTRVGYNNSYMSMGWFAGYYPIDGWDTFLSTTKISMALIPNMSEESIANAEYERIATKNVDFVDEEGNVVLENDPEGAAMTVNGNGFIYYTGNFGLYKYYLMKIEKENGEYVTIAYKVTDENDEMGSWIQSMPNLGNENTDPNGLPFYYHDKTCQTTGSFWYDSTDLKLSSISCYNGNYLAVHISDVVPMNADISNIRIDMAYASVDKEGIFVHPSEDAYKTVPIYNKEGTHTLQLQLPTLMEELPIHSEMGGTLDDEYYSMRVYYDTENDPTAYVDIPVRIKAHIPMIEGVNGLAAAARGESLSVSWTNTATQDAHGYLYDIYIDGELVSENVPAGAYNFTGYDVQTIGKNYNVRVVAKWCEQTTDASVTYVIEKPEEDFETLPGEEIEYPNEWVLIDGEYILPVLDHNTVSKEVKAKIYYYTDRDLDSVVGYNGSYIALNGSTKYFTGNSSKIFVQNGDSTTFVSKGIYDNFYPGKTLMQSAQMFSTYGNWTTGTELFYTVKVVGDNGNTSKNFYFKIVPTDEEYTEPADGEWREISGQSKLPVKIGNTSLEGTVYFYDYPSRTNTYDIVGYNGYYMSIIGKGDYYSGSGTTIEISKALDDTSIETNTADILANVDNVDYEFTSKEIADKVYSGQIIIRSEDTFTVAYGTTYYLLKVNGVDAEGNDATTYVPIKIVVATGDVEVQGFQMNTNTSLGGVAEFNPSFRVVSKASKVMAIDNVLYVVKGYGTVYGLEDNLNGNYDQMTIGGGKDVHYYETTAMGTYQGYTSGNGDEKYYNYYALTFKGETYYYNSLTAKYAFRAYAVLDDGTTEGKIVYGENVYSASIYEIAENLYDNSRMPNVEAHNYLYDNVLNIVAIGTNRNKIAAAMNKALGVTSTSMPDYQLVNAAYKDMYNYIHCKEGYTYLERGAFTCSDSAVETELLGKLNTAAGTEYATISEWVYNKTSSYKNSAGVAYVGFYEKVPYDWDSNIFKDFDSE